MITFKEDEKEKLRRKRREEEENTRITTLIRRPVESRTVNECKEIAKYFKLEIDKLTEIGKMAYFMEFPPEHTIFKEGDIGREMYFILSGCVQVYVKMSDNDGFFGRMRLKKELKPREYFGEIALQYDCQRTASCISKFRTSCLVIDISIYNRCLSIKNNQNFSTQIIKTISDIPAFGDLSKDEILDLVGECVIQLYPTNTLLFKEGEKTNSFWIVKSGRVKIMKTINISKHRGSKLGDNLFIKGLVSPTSMLSKKSTKMVQVDEFGKGEVMGVNNFIFHENFGYTAITIIPTEIIIISFNDIKKYIQVKGISRLERRFSALLKNYPSNQELREMYFEKVKWQKFKKDFLRLNRYENRVKKARKKRTQFLKSNKNKIPKNILSFVKGNDENEKKTNRNLFNVLSKVKKRKFRLKGYGAGNSFVSPSMKDAIKRRDKLRNGHRKSHSFSVVGGLGAQNNGKDEGKMNFVINDDVKKTGIFLPYL